MSNWSRGNCSENFPENSGKSERHHNGIVQSPCTMYLLLGQWPFSGHYSKSKTFDKFLSAASTDTPEQLNTNHPFIRTPKRSLKMVDKTFDLSAQFLARTEVRLFAQGDPASWCHDHWWNDEAVDDKYKATAIWSQRMLLSHHPDSTKCWMLSLPLPQDSCQIIYCSKRQVLRNCSVRWPSC